MTELPPSLAPLFILLLGASVLQGLFFAALALFRPVALSVRVPLALLLLALAASIAHAPVLTAFLHLGAGRSLHSEVEPTQFLLAPMAWLYVRAIALGRPIALSRAWPHFLPSIAVVLAFFVAGSREGGFLGRLDAPLVSLAFSIQVIIYLFLSHRAVSAARQDQARWSSHPDPGGLAWISPLLIGLALTWLLQAPIRVWLVHGGPATVLQNLLSLIMGIMVFGLGFFALRRSGSLGNTPPEAEADSDPGPRAPMEIPMPAQRRPDEASRALFEDLSRLMAEDRSYRRPSLTIRELAALIDVPYWRLSQVINENAGMHFFDYVNRLRVAEVERALSAEAGSGRSILSFALEAGFSSKAAFNKAFKKHTGRTPRSGRGAPMSTFAKGNETGSLPH
ncbi:MAG: AraC family transcriptional regulator [Spirochaetes bacterium]|nr:AraC family transcriptional regulator [Spirochaetota bacterium]